MNTVSKAKVISSSEREPKSALACLGALSSTGSGIGSPRRAESIPSRITRYPWPPASTTPAFWSTGFISVVCSSTFQPTRTASARTKSMSLLSSAASRARLAARRETVSTVPSVGFITAL